MSAPNPDGLDAIDTEILARRTAALARPVATAEAEGVECLVVRSGGQRYAVELTSVLSASQLTRLAPAPFAPPEVAGLTMVGNTVCPVFHLHRVLGLRTTALSEHGRLVLLGTEPAPLALAVDVAEAIVRLREDRLHGAPEGGRTRELARGVTDDGIVWLDHALLMAHPTLVLDVASHDPSTDD
jgi:purine-binding chemotaxis protein CheW